MKPPVKLPAIACAFCLSWVASAVAQDGTTSTAPMVPVAEETTASASNETSVATTEPLETFANDTATTAANVQQEADAASVVTPETSATAVVENATSLPVTTTEPADTTTSITTPEGVAYQVLKPGNGPKESTTQTLLLHYTLFVDGKKVESSRDAEFPVPLRLKRNTDSFIKGFEIGTEGMHVGEVRRIYIPAELGYGEKGNEVIPPNTPLVFEAELVDLK